MVASVAAPLPVLVFYVPCCAVSRHLSPWPAATVVGRAKLSPSVAFFSPSPLLICSSQGLEFEIWGSRVSEDWRKFAGWTTADLNGGSHHGGCRWQSHRGCCRRCRCFLRHHRPSPLISLSVSVRALPGPYRIPSLHCLCFLCSTSCDCYTLLVLLMRQLSTSSYYLNGWALVLLSFYSGAVVQTRVVINHLFVLFVCAFTCNSMEPKFSLYLK